MKGGKSMRSERKYSKKEKEGKKKGKGHEICLREGEREGSLSRAR